MKLDEYRICENKNQTISLLNDNYLKVTFIFGIKAVDHFEKKIIKFIKYVYKSNEVNLTCADSEENEFIGFVFLKDNKEISDEKRENFISFIMDAFYINKKESLSYSEILNFYSFDYLIFDFNVKPF